jgi:hypothetical protein
VLLLLELAVIPPGVVLPPLQGLTVQAFRAILLLCGTRLLWVFQPKGLTVSALIGMVGILLLGSKLPARAMVFATVLPSGLTFMLPTGTPAMATVCSSG